MSSAFVSEVGQTFIDNQRKLGELKSWILAQPDSANSGYIDQINDAPGLSTQLLWHGDSKLKASVIAEAARRGIKATILERPHSLPEINSITKKLEAHADQLAAAGFTLASVVGVQVDTGEIQVEGAYTAASLKSADAQQRSAVNTVSVASELAGVPVKVVGGVTTTPTVTRSTDTNPFWAGGYMINAGGGVCSTGFALSYNGVNHITTARHCNATSYTARNGTASYGGTIATTSDAAVSILSAGGAGRTFDNTWDNSAGINKSVYNIYDVGLNDLICTSGGNSGVHCNIKVTAMNVSFNDNTGNGTISTIRGVQQTAGAIANIQGDSGGPVFMPYGGGDAQRVGAVGMIQGLESGSVSGCGSVHDQGTNLCSKTVLFSSIHTAILYGGLGLSLVSGG
ncbi:chymotrypsin family serine protease [Subtercola frigoramans]|uniref:Uncharacterized protein n=1 Tax=Subtercola frigoramans TaxID=120298 RepID=A0ABS2L4Y2_9MICO|nr:hypothetical protein [Subtercola frigoramans]MBM7472123.1 hypothetical protein [Subtercola frigoramans]